jgi:hypothetical protein
MGLVLDVSVLGADPRWASGRLRLADERLVLFLAEHTAGEIAHELPGRIAIVAGRRGLDRAVSERLANDGRGRYRQRGCRAGGSVRPARALGPFGRFVTTYAHTFYAVSDQVALVKAGLVDDTVLPKGATDAAPRTRLGREPKRWSGAISGRPSATSRGIRLIDAQSGRDLMLL